MDDNTGDNDSYIFELIQNIEKEIENEVRDLTDDDSDDVDENADETEDEPEDETTDETEEETINIKNKKKNKLPVERLYPQSHYQVYREQSGSCIWCSCNISEYQKIWTQIWVQMANGLRDTIEEICDSGVPRTRNSKTITQMEIEHV
ncbi:hypothetical protein C2G38_2048854 [Gigaspora rosea]|uniref:Uncharacterized protein n=1 Tax=Gigaspora rosea TaxID=44941 RepID=A0A397U5C2_9GLOM|nr:hypothetical protein C2G38_2048854 [Gigaspora rosea]